MKAVLDKKLTDLDDSVARAEMLQRIGAFLEAQLRARP